MSLSADNDVVRHVYFGLYDCTCPYQAILRGDRWSLSDNAIFHQLRNSSSVLNLRPHGYPLSQLTGPKNLQT